MATADPGVGSWTPINMFAMLRALINNGCPIVTNSGAPTNGTSGTYAGQAGIGALLIDYINAEVYQNTGTLASPIWTIFVSATSQVPLTALSVNGAIPVASASYVITKAGVLADTLAAPPSSAAGGDGIYITITSDNANLHTITFTGGTLDSGGAGVTTATFNAFKGASLDVQSYNGRWKVISSNGVNFS